MKPFKESGSDLSNHKQALCCSQFVFCDCVILYQSPETTNRGDVLVAARNIIQFIDWCLSGHLTVGD